MEFFVCCVNFGRRLSWGIYLLWNVWSFLIVSLFGWHLAWEELILFHHGKCYFSPSCGTQTSCFYFVCFFND